MIPLYAFVEGDTLGLLVLARERETFAELAERLQRSASLRVAPRRSVALRCDGRLLPPRQTVAEGGLRPLERIDLLAEGE